MIFLIFWTKPLTALPFCSLANSAEHASAPRALQGAGFRLHCLAATACGGPSNPAYVTPRKIHPWIFRGLQKRFALLHVAKPPSVALYWLASTSEKIHPWIFRGLQKRFALLHVAKSPSMALYWLASTSEKIHPPKLQSFPISYFYDRIFLLVIVII